MARVIKTDTRDGKHQISMAFLGLVLLTMVGGPALALEPILPPGRVIESKKCKISTLADDKNPDDLGESLDGIPVDHICLLTQKPRSIDVSYY